MTKKFTVTRETHGWWVEEWIVEVDKDFTEDDAVQFVQAHVVMHGTDNTRHVVPDNGKPTIIFREGEFSEDDGEPDWDARETTD